ncbi:hypothetical protein SLS53_003073 [Cytospora paraplurivora]|uniref:FAD-binding domain-containing protein n=1 Tax=Cytospora paraplurivora TaxID=2898453 RepID=A0AAN9UDE1_9PEZI
MSHPTKGIEQGTSHTILGKGSSYIFLTGGGKVYWFLNTKNSQIAHGEDVPRRYSAEDEHQLAKKHFRDQLNEHDTFEDVYKQRIMSTLTPLHEYQWKHWYFERIITIGDASHKLHPISGNGGAAAAEDAAALVNALHRKLQDRTHRLSTEDCEQVFADTQRAQEKRTKAMLHHATKMQEFDAMQSLLAPLLVKFVVPNLTDDAALNIIGENVLGGQRVEALPIPRRPRYVPYVDELPARPLNDLCVGKVFSAVVQSGFALPLIMANIPKLFKSTPCHLDSYLKHYTHAATVSGETSCSAQSCMVALIPIVLIWNTEGFRRGNTKSLGSWCVLIFALQRILQLTVN